MSRQTTPSCPEHMHECERTREEGSTEYGAGRHRGTALCVACAATPRLRGDQAWPTGQGAAARSPVHTVMARVRRNRCRARALSLALTATMSGAQRRCRPVRPAGSPGPASGLLIRVSSSRGTKKRKGKKGQKEENAGLKAFENAHAVDEAQAADDWARLTRRVHERRPQTEAALTTPPTPQRST